MTCRDFPNLRRLPLDLILTLYGIPPHHDAIRDLRETMRTGAMAR